MTRLSLATANPVTGLIPAAGRGSRLPNLTCSKELLPLPGDQGAGTQLAIEYSARFLLDCGIERQHVVIAPNKTDIADFLGDGSRLGAQVSYTEIADSPGVPYSLAAAYEQIATATVVLVFPDIMFEPRAAISACLAGFTAHDCDVLLPLVPSSRGDKVDMVAADSGGFVREILPKPGAGHEGWTWVAAAWSPAFTSFLNHFVHAAGTGVEPPSGSEIYVGDVMNAAIADGLSIRARKFASGKATDIGTPDDLAAVWRQSTQDPPAALAAILRGF
jgi:glucose-1-phosphate thymidylyltransferase